MGMIGNFKQVTPKKLEELKADPSKVSEYIYKDKEFNSLDIDKSWNAIHWLLNGSDDSFEGPLGRCVLGGTDIGLDVGYGPARYLTPEEVKETVTALKRVSNEELISRYNAEDMTADDVYPEVWGRKEEEQFNKEYILENYPLMVSYYQDAARHGNGMLIYIN
ncbi:MAG: YfbM family protein [bacterium]|nr:YfbM family protein [bacterium]